MGAWVYHSWAPRLAALGVEVLPLELPGRNSRRREPPATNLLQMAAAVPAEPGAIHLPAHVFVSGIRAPHLSAAGHDLEPTRLHTLADPDAFWAAFTQRYGNTNPLLADPRVRQLVWPVLRADFQLAETYVMPVGRNTPLPVPLTVFGGELDGRYTREQLEAWRHHVALAAPSASHPAAASSSFSPAAAPGWRLVLLPGVGHDYVEKWQQQEQQQKQKQQEKKLQGPGAGDGGGGLGGAGLIAELEAALAAAVLAAEEAPGCY
ncbi:hypothetical protein HYH02_007109 [Chlamydomonas schloesseri]|uniref:Uncharacterized protein n=1 Tax=Chlamydomonas schloesseri TaxID=2026947 RepID=A0A835WIZ4_9CHLO|nr:hypothetical protein HYH02_007109 [Chlamydomonas schloesseri]|eukprot:KAG2448084.1 hypothetical protein HYH02_007109 [Chlamydomonas schloesseri]